VTALLAATGAQTTGMVDASVRALAKLHHVLPPSTVGSAAAVRAAAHTPSFGRGPEVDPHVVALLAESCRDAAAVRFAYERRDGESAQRRVEPHSLVTVRSVWYLIAYDLDRADWRMFRLDRIAGSVERTGHGAPRRALPTGDPLAFVAASLADMPFDYTATLDVAAAAHDVLGRLPWLNARRVDDRGRRACRVRLGASDLDELTSQVVDVIALGHATSIDAPPAVVAHLERVAAALTGGSPPSG